MVSMMLLLFLAMVVLTLGDNNPGTTVHIKDIFVGRCYDYKQVKYKVILPEVATACEDLYAKFFMAFSFMAPCAVNKTHYVSFMEAAQQQIPRDKAMFWSGVKDLAHEYADEGERFITLEDTLIGYVVDGLVWCGQEITPGMNYSRCPSWNDCPSEASEAFWAMASMTFASSTSGTVTVLLDGSRMDRPAYRRDSFFGQYELPFMPTGDVTTVRVFVVHPLNGPRIETCDNGSLAMMKEDVTAQGFKFVCVDDPQAILHLLCADDPTDRVCHLASAHMFGDPNPPLKVSTSFNAKRNRLDSTSENLY